MALRDRAVARLRTRRCPAARLGFPCSATAIENWATEGFGICSTRFPQRGMGPDCCRIAHESLFLKRRVYVGANSCRWAVRNRGNATGCRDWVPIRSGLCLPCGPCGYGSGDLNGFGKREGDALRSPAIRGILAGPAGHAVLWRVDGSPRAVARIRSSTSRDSPATSAVRRSSEVPTVMFFAPASSARRLAMLRLNRVAASTAWP